MDHVAITLLLLREGIKLQDLAPFFQKFPGSMLPDPSPPRGAWDSPKHILHPEKTGEKDFIPNSRFRPHGLPRQNREQSGEGRSYIPVPRQRDTGAPVPGTVNR